MVSLQSLVQTRSEAQSGKEQENGKTVYNPSLDYKRETPY